MKRNIHGRKIEHRPNQWKDSDSYNGDNDAIFFKEAVDISVTEKNNGSSLLNKMMKASIIAVPASLVIWTFIFYIIVMS
jgi:hypothetical protein